MTVCGERLACKGHGVAEHYFSTVSLYLRRGFSAAIHVKAFSVAHEKFSGLHSCPSILQRRLCIAVRLFYDRNTPVMALNMSPKTSCIDLLIIGAGPAGLMAAAWASRYNISTRIIDKVGDRVLAGHADGLQPRTFEIFDSFGFADCLWKDSYHDIEICSWVSGVLKNLNLLAPKQRAML